MSTRSQTKVMFASDGHGYGGGPAVTFYRHCDGYPEGHGCDLCNALVKAGDNVIQLLSLLELFEIEVEEIDAKHGDIEYLYEVELPTPCGYYPDGIPEPRVRVHHVRSNTVVYEGTPKDVRMAIVMGKAM